MIEILLAFAPLIITALFYLLFDYFYNKTRKEE